MKIRRNEKLVGVKVRLVIVICMRHSICLQYRKVCFQSFSKIILAFNSLMETTTSQNLIYAILCYNAIVDCLKIQMRPK